MRRSNRQKADLGNPISIEDALSIMVVVFVLFLVFFLPMVNIDKMKLDEAQKDVFWQKLSLFLNNNDTVSDKFEEYNNAFDLDGLPVRIDIDKKRNVRYIQSVNNNNITIVQHDLRTNRYISLYIPGYSKVVTYNVGKLKWSEWENIWFTVDNSLDYNESGENIQMQKDYRKWVEINGWVN